MDPSTRKELLGRIRRAGVVGAGGSGFPTYVKLDARCDVVLANGAECEPLLAKDQHLMAERTEQMLAGLTLAAALVGASRKVLGVKDKHVELLERLRAKAPAHDIEIAELADVYPAGDEVVLVHDLTGRRVPPAGLPKDVGVLVQNVETLANLAAAAEGEPVTTTWLTVCGAVREPFTAEVPVGTRAEELLAAAGGFHERGSWVALEGGAMMGHPIEGPKHAVTKTTAALLFLPADHRLVRMTTRSDAHKHAIGRAACDQCSYCTQFCPRYLLGYAIEPHRVMRSLGFGDDRAEDFDPWGQLCCHCGICDLYACPEDLAPRDACIASKDRARVLKRQDALPPDPGRVHPMREGRLIPTSQLKQRLDLRRYDHPAPYRTLELPPQVVEIGHRQHVGATPRATVQRGATVAAGDPLTAFGDEEMGAPVHAPFDGVVESVSETATVLRRS